MWHDVLFGGQPVDLRQPTSGYLHGLAAPGLLPILQPGLRRTVAGVYLTDIPVVGQSPLRPQRAVHPGDPGLCLPDGHQGPHLRAGASVGAVRGQQGAQEQQVPQHADLGVVLAVRVDGCSAPRDGVPDPPGITLVGLHSSAVFGYVELVAGASLLVLQLIGEVVDIVQGYLCHLPEECPGRR